MMPAANIQGRRLSELFDSLPQGLDCMVSDLTQDSRDVTPGCLFLARQGGSVHGLDYFKVVVEKGAEAVAAEPSAEWSAERIAEIRRESGFPLFAVEGLGMKSSAIASAFFGEPSASLYMVGITGTNGKTSCSHAIAQAMMGVQRMAVVGTLGNGEPGALKAATHTTPDAVELQRMLAGFKQQGVESVAMEVSSHALDQGRIEAVRFDTAVFTNLSRDHLDYHGDMESYGTAKKRLFLMPGLKVAIVNGDDPFAGELIDGIREDVRLVVYGQGELSESLIERADRMVKAEMLKTTPDGLNISVRVDGRSGEIQSQWMGRFNASNLLAVLAVLLESEIEIEPALKAVAELKVVGGRMEPFGGGEQPSVVVDYAHTPDALEQVLLALRGHCRGQLICLFGCGGDRDKGKRPLMGKAAEKLADRVIVTDDNPRHEMGDAIVADILTGMTSPDQVEVERDRAKAIAMAIETAEAGDIVAVCGKGHETTQQIGDLVHEFSDRDQVLKRLGVVS